MDLRRWLWCGEAEALPQLHSVAHPTEQVAPLTQHKGMLSVEDHTGEVAGLTVPDRVVFPAVAAVFAHQKGAVAAAGPNGSVVIPCQIHVAVAVSDRDDRLAPTVEISRLIVEPDLSTASNHPEIAIGLEADALQPMAAHALVHLPDGITRFPCGVKVAQATHAHVAAIVAASQVADGTCGIGHLGLPAAAVVMGLVDRPHVGGHLCGMAAQGRDQVGLAGQFGVEEQAGPVLATVVAVHQQPRLSGDPAFIAIEIDADQAEVFFVGQVQAAFIPMGAPVVGFPDHPVAAHQVAVAAVCKGHIQRIGLGVEIHGLPGAGGGRGDVGRNAAAQADPQYKNQYELGRRVQQTFHGLASAQGIKG
jgi:hypothetical protein